MGLKVKGEEAVETTTKHMQPGQIGIVSENGPHNGILVLRAMAESDASVFCLGDGDHWNHEPNLRVRILPPGTLLEVAE